MPHDTFQVDDDGIICIDELPLSQPLSYVMKEASCLDILSRSFFFVGPTSLKLIGTGASGVGRF